MLSVGGRVRRQLTGRTCALNPGPGTAQETQEWWSDAVVALPLSQKKSGMRNLGLDGTSVVVY